MAKPVKKINMNMITFKKYMEEAVEGKLGRVHDAIQKNIRRISTGEGDIKKTSSLISKYDILLKKLGVKNEKVGAELAQTYPAAHKRIVNKTDPALRSQFYGKTKTSIDNQIVGHKMRDEKNLLHNPERSWEKNIKYTARGINLADLN